MCAVKDQDDQLHTHTDKILYHDQHAALLLYAETGYDDQFASASARSTGNVYNTELGGSYFGLDSPSEVIEDLDYDVNASITTLLENMTNSDNSNSDSYLPLEDYSFLTPWENIYGENLHLTWNL